MDRELIYKLLQILGRMEVDKGDGKVTIWVWDSKNKKPVKIA